MRPVRRAFLRHLTKSLCLIATLLSGVAYAAMTITENVSPSFGTLLGGANSRQFILNIDDTVSGADAADYLFGAVSGELELDNKGSQSAINILADNISTSGGLSANQILCKFGPTGEARCDNGGFTRGFGGGPGTSYTLLLGLDISTSQMHSGGDTAYVYFDIEITFQ